MATAVTAPPNQLHEPTMATAKAAPSVATASSTTVRSGHFQTITTTPTSATIADEIYGTHTLTEPLLLSLLPSPAVQRLAHVAQHGITAFLGQTPKVTRLEHSVGAMLLVRSVGASVHEQAAALLHDVSHTAFSHVADAAFPSPVSFHEAHKHSYVARTDIPSRLAALGAPHEVLDEESYGLVEQPAPHLCADRLDYGLRDAVAFGLLPLSQAHAVFSALRACPSPLETDVDRHLALVDSPEGVAAAHAFARAYSAADELVWSNPAQSVLYSRTGDLIAAMVRRGDLAQDRDMWLDDDTFWAKMKAVATAQEREEMERLETEAVRPVKRIAHGTKIRTIDPDMLVLPEGGEGVVFPKSVPLSRLLPEWKVEREEYIARREAEMCECPG